MRSRAAPRRSSSQRPLPAAGAAGPGGDVRAAMARRAAASSVTRPISSQVVGVTGTNGKTTTAFLVRGLLEAGGRQTGLLGTVTSVIGGAEPTGAADDAGGDRPAADLPGDARRRRRRVRDRGLLARAGAAPCRRRHVTRPRSSRTSPRTTSTSIRRWRTTSPPSARLFTELAPRVAIINIDDPYGARLAAELDRADHVRARAPDATYRAESVRTGLDGFALHASTGPDGRAGARARRCAGASTSTTCSARSPQRARSASRCGRGRRGDRPGRAGPRPVRARRRRAAVRGARRLRAHAGLAGERAQRRARS